MAAKSTRQYGIHLLQSNKDGYQQIDNILKQRGSTAELKIFTADVDGKPCLGSSQILKNLSAKESMTVIGWGDFLADNAEITFYGNPVDGRSSWSENLYALTGSAVSWSRDGLYPVQSSENFEPQKLTNTPPFF